MRAWDILIFLTGFNAMLWMFDAMGVLGTAGPGGRLLSIPGSVAVGALALAIFTLSRQVLGTSITQPIGILVYLFVFFHHTMLAQAMLILSEFRVGATQIVPTPLIAVLVLFNELAFVAGIAQMVSGGWRSAK